MTQLPFEVDASTPTAKREVLRAALQLFVSKGLAATTVRDIAAESGFSNPVLFKYFENREALALFLFEKCYLQLSSDLHAAVRAGATFDDRLHHLITRYAEIVDQHPALFLYVQENLRDFWPKISETARQRSILRLLRDLFRDGVKEGVVRADAEVPLLVVALSGFLSQFARMVFFNEFPGGAGEWTAKIEETFSRMVKA